MIIGESLIIFVIAIIAIVQKGFDNFKQRVKDWMDFHPEEYDSFEEEMNRKDSVGYQEILATAFAP